VIDVNHSADDALTDRIDPVSHPPIIEVRGLRTAFGRTVVHDKLDLDVRRGEVIGVVGGSGTGKSVLLRTIVGLMRPAAGHARVFGAELATLDDASRRQYERRFGVLFQDGALFSSLTVAENIKLPLAENHRLPADLLEQLVQLKIRLVGLPADAGAKYPSQLSGGMRKRAGIARALALDPEILFLDEPTAGLDPIGAAKFDQLILTLTRALNLTLFLVTHDLDSLYALADRVAVLAEGRVLVVDRLEVVERYPHPWVREYFHGPRARAARGPTDNDAEPSLVAPAPST
jgi:phospholipid/cholesterol/gamma-HCH transport system ATP-binding protein